MQMTMRQVWGVAVTEMRLQWRRRAMLVILLSFSGMMLLMTLLQRRSLVAEGMLDLPLDVATITVLFGVGPVGMLVMLLTLPAVVAETVPKDRQFGMAELLAAALQVGGRGAPVDRPRQRAEVSLRCM